jgi:DNA-binding winged helix-turn-helix (wHTH) protein
MPTEHSTPAPAVPALHLRFSQFELDEADARLSRAGRPVPLAPRPFAVLCALARTPRTLVTKNALLDSVWGHRFVSESVLKSTISELRAALEDNPKQPRYIETVSRRGYRFIAAVSAAAVPAATPGPLPSSVIGRRQALERLRNAWRLAAGGRRQIVWLAGEAGVGKTTLAEQFMAEVGEVHCTHGQCVEQYGAGEPYLPVLEALTALCRRDAAAAELIRSSAPTWLLQLPSLSSAEEREALRRDLAGAGPERMLREMGEFLDRYTEDRPLVLATADLHWSDQATVQLMNYIARRRSPARLLWLASYRLTEIIAAEHPLHAVRNELRLHGLADEIVLDAFSEMEVAEYLAEHLPERARDEAFVRALHRRTDGLPLFVADVVKEIAQRGAPPGATAIPTSLAGIIERYIGQLGPAERALLEAASVCGTEFRLYTVASVLERDPASVAQSCADLARQHRWLSEIDERYVFRHALYREVLYKSLGPLARVALHRQVGAALERERADRQEVSAAELALHFDLGRQPMSALAYYTEAAETAARVSAQECIAIADQAARLLVHAAPGAERDALEVTLGTLRGLAATRVLGAGNDARAALQRAYALLDEMPEHPMRRRLLHGFGYMLHMRGEYAEALAVANRAQALGASGNDPVLMSTACTLHGQVDHLQGRPHAARGWLERGLGLVERLEVAPGEYLVDPQVALLGSLSVPLVHLGVVEQARACLRRAHARARDGRFPMARLSVLWHEALLEVRLGDAERVAALAAEMRGLVDEFALAHGRTACRWFGAWADARLANPREAFRAIREAYEENVRLGMLAGASEILAYATEALLIADDVDGARKQLEEALRVADKLGERVYLVQLRLLEARVADARGEKQRAREAIAAALAEARAQEAPWPEMLALSARCERREATAADRASLAAALERVSGAEATTPFARARALVG